MRAVLAARSADPMAATVVLSAGGLVGLVIVATVFLLGPSPVPTARQGGWIVAAAVPAPQRAARAEAPRPEAPGQTIVAETMVAETIAPKVPEIVQPQPTAASNPQPRYSLASVSPPVPAPVTTRPAVDAPAFTARWPLSATEDDSKPTGSIRLALADESAPAVAPAPQPRVPAEATRIKPLVRKSEPVAKHPVNPLEEVDRYLWQVYERSPVKKDSSGDFTWKDQAAAKRMHMPLKAYVIGGMEPDFREQLYHAGHAMDAAGLHWSMLSAFRDDYRQELAKGFKARTGNSLHGGSRAVGGYGHGRAVDINYPDGEDDAVWHWIDAHGAKYGLRRPMPGYDPAHIQAGGEWHAIAQTLRASRARLAEKAKPRNTAAAKSKDAKTAM
ncbi:MAG TPA: hypothetical protein VFU97_11925 [Xanthobacteraceae bacterium]|nr:hypothetical protein [Xanthobacteraceae bacterium]